MVKRFEVYLIALEPVQGSEIAKTRPGVVVSPDSMNGALRTVIVAPMTTALKAWPTRTPCSFQGKSGQVALDQVRAVDKVRLVKKLGALSEETSREVCSLLTEMFAFE